MSSYRTSSPRIPDVLWQGGAPLRRRLSRRRRVVTAVLFVLFSTTIGAYWFVTDSTRVRTWAEDYLSRITGGQVTVRRAALSIFEGLRLDDVRVSVDRTGSGQPGTAAPRPDATIFTADAFLVRVNLTRLVRGRVEASSITAVGPRVRLVEDVAAGRWNYERLRSRPATTGPAGAPDVPPALPEVILRDARVEYGRLVDGRIEPQGAMTIEAQLVPDDSAERRGRAFRFRVQSRGTALMGPRVAGTFDLDTRRIEAALSNFEFGRDVKAMLPDQVQRFWERHRLAGRVNLPRLAYTVGGGPDGDFLAQIQLDGVTLQAQPEQAHSTDEAWRRRALDEAFGLLKDTGADAGGWVSRAAWLIEPEPVVLTDARGLFTFTPQGVVIDGVVGRVQGNSVRIDGTLSGYSPDAPAELVIRSPTGEAITLPPGWETMRWVNTLPPGVREVYDHFRPRGTAAIRIELSRPSPGARVAVRGEIDILDGAFTFDRFPYPIDRATGRIAFGPDPARSMDALAVQLKGFGASGGPNERSEVFIDGEIAPLRGEAAVDIRIRGRNIRNEPVLMRSFPPVTRRALSFLDAEGKGAFPQFTGDFVCGVYRPAGPRQPWTTNVDIDLRDGAGALLVFPYPLSGVTGQVKVREGYVEIVNATMRREGMSLTIDGRVDWSRPEGPPAREGTAPAGDVSIRPSLRVTARDAPIDDNLLNALPDIQAQWMRRLGLQGRFDLEGTVTPGTQTGPGAAPADFGFAVRLKEGTIWPKDGTFVIDRVSGLLQVEPRRMTLKDLRGRRGDADLTASGTVEWPDNRPRLDLTAEATNLELDGSLFQILPSAGKAGWEAAAPEGTADARLRVSGPVGDAAAGPVDYLIELKPRKLAVRPQAFPCRFTDLTGDVRITPSRVELNDLIARRGDARVRFGGVGDLKAGEWTFALSADRVGVDDELRAALPPTLSELMRAASMSGTYDVRFDRLRTRRASTEATTASATAPPADVDFKVRLETRDGALQAGVAMTGVVGRADFAGESRAGRIGRLDGTIDVDSLSLGGRPVEQLSATLSKTSANSSVRLSDLRCRLSGGQVAGQLEWAWPEEGDALGAARYALALTLRDADVRELVGDTPDAPQLRGRLTAGIALEGTWDDPASRRGRGDVLVEGRDMYRVPLLLGLLQITNLALPITSPFERAVAQYSIEGNRLTFESLELAADQMKMSGSGHLDFAEKQVRMTFVTDSTAWPKLPIVGDLLQGARHELLQIHVRGSLQEPKVTAGSLGTITTTIDEVFRGDGTGGRKR